MDLGVEKQITNQSKFDRALTCGEEIYSKDSKIFLLISKYFQALVFAAGLRPSSTSAGSVQRTLSRPLSHNIFMLNLSLLIN